jgi:ribonuclease HI
MHGLRITKDLGIKQIQCFGDSDLVTQQVSGTWDTKDPHMIAYKVVVDEFAKCFKDTRSGTY